MDWPGPRGQYENKDLPSIPEFPAPPLSPRREGSRPQWTDPRLMGIDRPISAEFFDPSSMQDYNSRKCQKEMGKTTKTEVVEVEDASSDEDNRPEPSALLVLSLFVSVFLSALDITIITTALPMIAEHLDTNATGFVWIGSAYLLAGAASEPIWAKVSDIFGRKPILMFANAVFLGGSTLCALSKSVEVLIIGRIVQGLGSGGLLVLVNILIGDLFSPRKRGAYYGLLGLVWSIANALGPFLGGLFATKMSWRWCFWVNVPIDGLALILTAVFLKVHTPYTPFWEGIKAIDWLGSLAVVGGTVSLLLGLEFGGVTFAWDSAAVITLIVSGIAIWVIFFLVETHVPKYPLIPVRIFKTVSNLSILAIDFSHGFVFIAGSYYLPVYFQAVLGASALQSGVYLFPFVLTLSITAIGTGYIINKTGSYLPLITGGMLFLTLGFALFTDLPAEASWARIVIYQIIAGIGVGPNFQSPMLALQNSVAPHDIGPATATFGFVRQLANAVSVVLGGVLLQSQLLTHRAELLDAGIELRVVDLLTGGSAISSVMEIDHLPKYPRQVARQAFASSMSKMWLMYVCVGIIGLGLTDFVRKKELSTEHTETVTGLQEQERIRLHEEEIRAARRAERPLGVLPDIEDHHSAKEDFGYGGKSAEVLGYSSSKPASLKSPGHSRASSSTKLESTSNSSKWNRAVDAGRDKNVLANAPGTLPPAPITKKEGALTAARRRSSLRQLSKKIADGRHPVQPLQTGSSTAKEEDQHELRDGTSSYYPEESGWYDDISDVDPLELERVNARIDSELRASQSWASRTGGQSPIAAWAKDVPNPYRNGRDGL